MISLGIILTGLDTQRRAPPTFIFGTCDGKKKKKHFATNFNEHIPVKSYTFTTEN